MENTKDLKPGDYVHYDDGIIFENGVVKTIQDETHAFVVYKCGGYWEAFYNYTAARTDAKYLQRGWK